MSRKEMEEKLIRVAIKTLALEDSSMSTETKKDDLLEWDSLGHTMLLMAVEQEFKVKFSFDEIKNSDSIKKIVNLVERKILI